MDDDSRTLTSCTDVSLSPELSASVGRVLREGESMQDFIESAVRIAMEARKRGQDADSARGEASWADYQRTGVSFPVGEVLDEMRALTERRRQQLGL